MAFGEMVKKIYHKYQKAATEIFIKKFQNQ